MLILKRASKSRPSGTWSDDDYDVFDGERHIGHILRTYFGQIVAGSRTANCDFSHFTFPRLGLNFDYTQGKSSPNSKEVVMSRSTRMTNRYEPDRLFNPMVTILAFAAVTAMAILLTT
jgi:hypothetical protein